jgi:O-antigen/teichoic acid export membrane protein
VKPLIYYAGLYGSSAALLKLAGSALFLLLARTLSVDDFARFGLLYALQQGLATFALAGIVDAVVGLLKEHRLADQRQQLFAGANTAFLLTAIGTLGFALVLWATYFRHFGVTPVTYASVVGCGVLLAFSSFQAQIVRLEEKHLWSFLLSFLPPFAGLVGGFTAVFLFETVSSFFIGYAGGVLFSLLSLWTNSVALPRISAGAGAPRRLFRTAVPFFGVAFLGWLAGYGNNYLINVFFMPVEVARFTFALSLSSVVALIASALNQVWNPQFYRLIQQAPFEWVEHRNRDFYRILGFALGLGGGLVILVFPFATTALGGNLAAYQSMTVELALLFSGYVVLTPWWHCRNHFLSNAMGKRILNITVITGLVGIAVFLVLMWFIGPIGIYIGFLAQQLCRSLGIHVAAKRRWPVRVSWSGVAIGLSLILVSLAPSTFGIVPVTAVLVYFVGAVMLVGVFYRADLNRLIAK